MFILILYIISVIISFIVITIVTTEKHKISEYFVEVSFCDWVKVLILSIVWPITLICFAFYMIF